MGNIEKRQCLDCNDMGSNVYFVTLLQEAYQKELLTEDELENIQVQCLQLLQTKCESHSSGKSSSIRVELAQSIMQSNFYTLGLYLQSLPDTGRALQELQSTRITELYQRGRKLVNTKLGAARLSYERVKKNKLSTDNYTYNATLSEGIGNFFAAYNPDYEAQETPASIDYQLCLDVSELTGVAYIQRYIEHLFLENEFCRHFDPRDIHHLLCGYDEGYKDLLINIFEQVLTAAVGCSLAGRSVRKMDLSGEEIQNMQKKLAQDLDQVLTIKIGRAAGRVLEELQIASLAQRKYIERSLPKITTQIIWSVRNGTLEKTLVSPLNSDLKPSIRFSSEGKMADHEYRQLIDEVLICRYSSDKLALIKEKVKSFDDLADVLVDAGLSTGDILQVFTLAGDIETAALLKRMSYQSDVKAVELTAAEVTLRDCLHRYIEELAPDRREKILAIRDQLIEEEYK